MLQIIQIRWIFYCEIDCHGCYFPPRSLLPTLCPPHCCLPCINHSCSISTDKSPQQIGAAFILKVTVPRLLSLSSLSSKKDSHHWLTGIMGSTLQHNDCSQSCLRGQAEAGLQTRPCARLALSSTLSFSFLISYFFFVLKTTPNSQQNICMRAPGLP